jgi:uncharacterized protein (TIGR03435 family)
MRGGIVRGNRYEVRTASMLELIATAYGMETSRIVGGPSWLGSDRFDIVAGAPSGTSYETANLMLQSLLAERFKLAIRKDTRPMPVFVLSAGKGKPKMKESKQSGSDNMGCKDQSESDAAANTGAYSVLICQNMTMDALADNLRGWANTYLPNPVINETNLKGNWDLELKWHARNQLAAAGSDATTIFDAVDKQLGLKLEPQQRPQPVIVISSVERNPTPNAADVVSKLPPPPPDEFEVATVKPSPPTGPQRAQIGNGRVDIEGIPLTALIQISWEITEQRIAGLPKSAGTNRFTITGMAPIPKGATSRQDVDEITARRMLKNLLIERFQIKSHMEDRLVEGYVMSANKPKLEKADPSGRTECKEGPGKDGKDPRNTNPILNRLMTCTNMTMAQLAEQLPLRVNGYVRTAVSDETGLKDPYDFTISFSGVNLVNSAGQPGADPSGALSFPDAMNKQLGIKLEMEKRMMPVLVIDHIEENPTEN